MPRILFVRVVCGIAAVAFLTSTAVVKAAETEKESSQAKEKKLTKEQIPAAVIAAFQKAYPKAVIKGVGQETEDAVTTFEIESVDGTVTRDLQYTADGKIVEIEESIDPKALPEVALRAVAKEYPKSKIEKAERITRGTVTEFELLIKTDESAMEIVVDSSGKIVNSKVVKADDDEEDEAAEVGARK